MARARPNTAAAQAYAEADLPAGREDWRTAGWAVVDLETTGLNPAADEIIAIAIVPIDGGRAQPGRAFYSLVRPANPPAAESIRIHGIRPSDLEAAPALDEILDDVLVALSGRLVVAHAAFVEQGFLTPVLATRGVRLRGTIADTRQLGRVWLAHRDPGTQGAAAAARCARGGPGPAGAPRAPRARRRADDGTGLPGSGEPSGAPWRAVGEDGDGAAEGAVRDGHQLC